MNPVQALNKLPSSAPGDLNLKDYLKGFFLTIWAFIVFVAPDILHAVNAFDFGQYKSLVSLLVYLLGFLLQRKLKGVSIK